MLFLLIIRFVFLLSLLARRLFLFLTDSRQGKLPIKCRHILGPFFRHDLHRQLQRLQGVSRQGGQLGQIPLYLRPGHPIHRRGRQHAGQGIVHSGGQGVYIRPGAGAAPLGVLLQRTEPTLRHLHAGGAGVEVQILSSPQIQNFHFPVRLKYQVVRA